MPVLSNPYLQVILAGAIWGLGGACVKLIGLPATSIAFFRCGCPVIILTLFFIAIKSNPFHGNIKMMMGASVLNALRIYLFFVGFLYAPVSQVILILYSWPVFSTLYAYLFLKEKISSKKIGLLFCAFTGMAIIFSGQYHIGEPDPKALIGLTAMLFHSMIYAATIVIFKKEINNYSKWETIFFQCFVGAIVFFPFLFINEPPPEFWQINISIIYGGVLGIGSFALFFAAMRKLDTVSISILSYSEILIAILFGIFLFNEPVTWNMALGGTLIVISAYILTRYKDKI
ncbi:MAG: DMT family transporter [Alphaproteobacteria bacterium]|nr:DMT family transporter [Alphaproteobacteria bacterium]